MSVSNGSARRPIAAPAAAVDSSDDWASENDIGEATVKSSAANFCRLGWQF